MKRAGKRLATALLLSSALAALWAAPAGAAFGLKDLDVTFTAKDGSTVTQAGSHPFAMTSTLDLNTTIGGPLSEEIPDEAAKDVIAAQMPGFVGNPTAAPRCSTLDFLERSHEPKGHGETSFEYPGCADNTVVGETTLRLGATEGGGQGGARHTPVFNLQPGPGSAAKLGFWALVEPVTIEVGAGEKPPFEILAKATNITQLVPFFGADLTLWGVPADPAHDERRGVCREQGTPVKSCPVQISEKPFLTLPGNCAGPLTTSFEADSWQHPGVWAFASTETHDSAIPPNPQGMSGCSRLSFSPTTETKASTTSAETGSGLDFSVAFHDEGLTSPTGIAQSEIKDAEVTLPEGVTINPSIAEGLGVCTPADLKRETLAAAPGEGCPDASKVGALRVDTPLVEEPIEGTVYVAQQDDPATTEPGAENPFDSLIALYLVLKNTNLGVLIKLPLKVEPDPKTGRLVATLEDSPQVPFSRFNFHFREGARAPLITPPRCGAYTTQAKFTPWARPSEPLITTSSFQISSGVGGGPCPSGGVPPFHPRFEAGANNNNAGSFSPFYMRLQRADGEQDMTKFSSILPPGELGSLAGVGKCKNGAIARAKEKTGREELARPSCPARSLIGHTLAGAGVGEALTYVKGQIYLGGPYHGDPLSVISITPAVAGPFDAGTVVVQLALTLNPSTAEVEVDGAASDPIPHILKGIVLKVRDLRVYVDRQSFTLNPTSCDESKTRATLFGSYLNVFDPSDDVPVGLSSRYQAANCQNLGFKPRLAFQLQGGTKRGGHPALQATYTPRAGDANVKGLIVRLPRSAFLDQGHIRTICTRVQFAAKACPPGAQYGFIKAWTPLLEEPLEGPVYLRSSNHKLPDLLFDLQGLVDVEVDTRIDSVHGGIRARIEGAPDAPISKVLLHMQGGNKGLIVNSRDLCGAASRANVELSGHNGKQSDSRPAMVATGCAQASARHGKRHSGH